LLTSLGWLSLMAALPAGHSTSIAHSHQRKNLRTAHVTCDLRLVNQAQEHDALSVCNISQCASTTVFKHSNKTTHHGGPTSERPTEEQLTVGAVDRQNAPIPVVACACAPREAHHTLWVVLCRCKCVRARAECHQVMQLCNKRGADVWE
jgi:hypothetical protein